MTGEKVNVEKRKRHLTTYLESVVWALMKKKPELSKEKATELAREYILKNAKPIEVKVDGSPISLDSLDRTIIKNGLIVSSYGTLFEPQRVRTNYIALMLDDLKKLRKVEKNLKFEYMGKDKIKSNKHDTNQKTYKVMANSYFGITGLRSSHVYHPYIGPSITYSGASVVTTSAIAIESFIGGKIFFMNINEIQAYIFNICNENYKHYDDISINLMINPKDVLDRLVGFVEEDYTEDEYNKILDFLDKLEQNELNKIYFKNNLFGLLDHTNVYQKYFKDLLGLEDFLDPNEPPERIKEDLDYLYSLLKDFVIYDYQDYHRAYRMNYKNRESVLTIN